MRHVRTFTLMVAFTASWTQTDVQAEPMGTAFTYQGQLKERGVPVDGEYDLLFRLYGAESEGTPMGVVPVNDWPITNGLFAVQLDFGSGLFNGNALWLEVAVRPGDSSDDHTVLSPRQPVTAAPYALYAQGGPGGTGGFWSANGADIYNTNGGNVGIGTSSPVATLQVVRAADASTDFAISGSHPDGIGVQGSSEGGYGVVGLGGGAGGIGVYGWGLGADTIGVFGAGFNENSYGGYFNGRGYFADDVGIRVQDPQASLDAVNWSGLPAIRGSSSGTGVYGVHDSTSGTFPGVWGATDSVAAGASGVRGFVNSTAPG